MILTKFSKTQSFIEKIFNRKLEIKNDEFVMKEFSYKFSHEEGLDKLVFKENKIFFKTENGELVQGYLIMNRNTRGVFPNRILGRDSSLPKFHTTTCKAIQAMQRNNKFNGTYMFSNVPTLMIDEAFDSKLKLDPHICGYCASDVGIDRGMRTKEYCDNHIEKKTEKGLFRISELPKKGTLVDSEYPDNWKEISKKIRKRRNYTCENCGIDLVNDPYYLEVHHIIPNTTMNYPSNLRCLCTCCHANVDVHHMRRYKSGKNHKKLLEFLDKFDNELRIRNNPCL